MGQKRKSSRASRSQLLSDTDNEDDSQEEQADNEQSESVDTSDKNNSSKKTIAKPLRSVRGAGGRKTSEKPIINNKKTDNSANNSVNSDKNQSQTSSRTLRSRVPVEQSSAAISLRRKQVTSTSAAATSVIPKKRQRIGEQDHQLSVSGSGSTNPESTGSGSKAPNLGARLARNQGGREPHNSLAQQQQDTPAHASTSTQQQTGHPPQNLLRRSSRGKGASSSSTTGSCVSFYD